MGLFSAALVGAGSSLLGGILGGRADKKAQQRQQAFDAANFAESLEHQNYWNQSALDFSTRQFEKGIRTRVADAKAAGLHPLFALGGATSGGSPGFSTGGHPQRSSGRQTGSALGAGISAAGRGLASAMTRGPLMQAELDERGARTDLIREQTRQLKIKEQLANSTRGPEGDWNQQPGLARITALPGFRLKGRSPGSPPSWKRPVENLKNQSIPRYIEQVGPKGRRRAINPALGLDELGQVFDAVDPWYQWFKSHLNRLKWRPNPSTHPEAYQAWKKAKKLQRRNR